MTPRAPNCARDWIICGRPIRGPWFAWKAMKKVPKQAPSRTARNVTPADSPSSGPVNPITIVGSTKLPVNQNGAWCQSLPRRSDQGM